MLQEFVDLGERSWSKLDKLRNRARQTLRYWSITVTIERAQDITVCFEAGGVTAIDEDGNSVDLTEQELAEAMRLKEDGLDETGR
jgi:hypothetical protein